MDDYAGARVAGTALAWGIGRDGLESVRRLQVTWDGQRSPVVGGLLPVYRTGEVHDR
jgi:hypothetical protein